MSDTDDRERTESRPRARRVRTLEADGYRWLVSEVPAPQFDRRGGHHLMFDGEVVMRRVRVFPENWFELSAEDLYALTDHLL